MLEKIKRHRLISVLLILSLILVAGGFFWAWFSLGRTGSPIIVHFDDLYGITTTTGRGIIVFAGIFGLAMVLVNASLAFEFEERSSLFGKLTAILTLALAILLFIAFAAILSVN